jgi:hypothetical protein
LASKPAITCGAKRTPKAIKNNGISNIKRTILKFKDNLVCKSDN